MLAGSWSTFWSALFAEKTETGNFSRNLFCQNQRSIIWVLFKKLGCLIWSAFRVKWIIRANLTWKLRFSSVSRGNCSKLICLNLLMLWFSVVRGAWNDPSGIKWAIFQMKPRRSYFPLLQIFIARTKIQISMIFLVFYLRGNWLIF